MDSPTPSPASGPGRNSISTDRLVVNMKRRLLREARSAIAMLEAALLALRTLDVDAARAVRREDDAIDVEEVEIEQACFQILALHQPYAREFRVLIFIIKVNAEIERVADHASSIAKIVIRINEALEAGGRTGKTPEWPTALTELGERVPAMCHDLMQAFIDEDVDAARRLVQNDKVIDQLDRRLFDEAKELLRGGTDTDLAVGMLVYRLGRELERVGDLMASIAEDVVYLATGSIIRHAKKRAKAGKLQNPGA